MTSVALKLDGVRRLPVSLSGAWQPVRERDWRGLATAPEPVVGVAFLKSQAWSSWCKSEPPSDAGLVVRLLLGRYDAAGTDVQVGFSVGGGHVRSRCKIAGPDYRPLFPKTTFAETGDVVSFATVQGVPDAELSFIFLAAADVQTGRKRLWHIRRELAAAIPEPLRKVLSYGRAGEHAA